MRVRTTSSGRAPASASAPTMISRQRRACSYAPAGGGPPSGITGAVPATCTCLPATTAREKPAVNSYGEPEEMRRRSMQFVVSPGVEALRQIESWGAETAAVALVRGGDTVAAHGAREAVLRWASVTKPVVALATLVAAEEGAIDLDQ